MVDKIDDLASFGGRADAAMVHCNAAGPLKYVKYDEIYHQLRSPRDKMEPRAGGNFFIRLRGD